MTTTKNGKPAFRALANITMVAALSVAAAAGVNAQDKAQDGVSKTAITLGQSLAMTGAGTTLATPFGQGARLYFDRVNAGGGINGRKVELVTLDDAGNPETTAANTKKLIEQKVFALFGYYGSPQVTAINPLLKDTDILLFAPMAGADELRGSLYPNVYSVRPGYSEEAAVITRH
ncbi:MAG: ABC transporter substrate-binding protein, partial [Polaromonas sp.]|nr:ABC transporter substrate-binding protein [Polaromonas sp.]